MPNYTRPQEQVTADHDALRAAGYCAHTAPFDNNTNSHIAAHCARLHGECIEHRP